MHSCDCGDKTNRLSLGCDGSLYNGEDCFEKNMPVLVIRAAVPIPISSARDPIGNIVDR